MGLKIYQLVMFCKRIQRTSHLPRREEPGGPYEQLDGHPSEAETEPEI